jgi:hypothetical protein
MIGLTENLGSRRTRPTAQVTDMDDQRSPFTPNGRDVAGAWVLCAVIAALMLGLASTTQEGMPPTATVAAKNVAPVAGLHRLTAPTPRPSDRRHG